MLTRRKNAFTLIEVLMVIVILGMLAGVAIMTFRGTREGAKEDTTRLTMKEIAGALDMYELAIGAYPTEEQGGLEALVKKPDFADESTGKKWKQFIQKVPKDAWGNDFKYELNEKGAGADGEPQAPFKLYSMGPDKQADTDDDIQMDASTEENK